jgi:SAM-dependent methyltransferase
LHPTKSADFLLQYAECSPDWAKEYLRIHSVRFQKTLEAIPDAEHAQARCIEFGTYGMFPVAMLDLGRYSLADGTTREQSPFKSFNRTFDFDTRKRALRMFDLDLEKEALPVDADYYDFVLCAEVIEHMATDPMAVLWEINRVLKPGGTALVSTPNVACSANIVRILEGKVPNSYYYYRSTRSSDRHNLEYSPELLGDSLKAAGFRVNRLWTEQCWNEPQPEMMKRLEQMGYSTENRDDNIFALVEKVAPPTERFPSFLYD